MFRNATKDLTEEEQYDFKQSLKKLLKVANELNKKDEE